MTIEPNDSGQLESPLRDAVAATLSDSVPETALDRVKARAKQIPLEGTTSSQPIVAPDVEAKRSRSWVGSLAIAATVVIVAGATLLFSSSGGQVFAQVIQNVNDATALRVDMISRMGRSPENEGQLLVDGKNVRIDQFGGQVTSVLDATTKRALFLDHEGKIAQLADLDDDVAKRFTNPIDELKRAKSTDAKDIGEEIVSGRRTRVYRLSKVDMLGIRGEAEMTVWVDSVTDLPARIVIRDTNPKNRLEVRLENFEWNPQLAGDLFSLQTPDGFQEGIVMKVPPKRQDRKGATVQSTYAKDGTLSRDRVPCRIVWHSDETVTALMREPESVPAHEQGSHEIRQWDLATGVLRWTQPVRGAGCLAVSSDGKWLATTIGDELQLRDATSGAVVHAWDAKANLITLAFSPDGKTLACGIAEWKRGGSSESGGVQFWDIERGVQTHRSAKEEAVTRLVTYSKDGKYLAAASNRSVKLLDASTGEMLRVFPGSSRVCFSPDSKTLACRGGSANKKSAAVELYDVASGSLLKTLTSDVGTSASWLLSIRYSQDGSFLAAADWNGTVTIWNLASGQRHTVTRHDGGVHAVAFSPGSVRFATGGEDRKLLIQTVPAK